MSIPVRAPSAHEDQPNVAVLVVIAVVGLAAGIGLARWGTYGPRDGGEAGAEAETETEPGTAAWTETATEDEPGRAEAAETGAEAGAETGTATDTATDTATGAGTTTGNEPGRAETEAAETGAGAGARTRAEDELAGTGAGAAGVAGAAGGESESVEGGGRAPGSGATGLRVARGRVAYLRCDGVPQRSGPVPCPRDEALEAAAWAVIDGLPSCPGLPDAEGEGDVVLDFATGRATEVRARDTFASDVVRLDRERVVACLAPTLGAVSQTMGSSRLMVSFRFALRRAP